jgi:hypothetical protein
MDTVVIIYHKKALTFYKHEWLKKCLDTIENQTYKKFDIFEVSYGNNDSYQEQSIVKYFDKLKNHKLFYFHKEMKDHSYALNFLLDKVFLENGSYKYCFNINIDDFYDITRFEKQIKIIEKLNYDVVSAQMIYVNEKNEEINKIDYLAYTFNNSENIHKQIEKEQKYIKNEFKKNHNIIAHPCVCFTKRFWKLVGPYPNKVPREDLLLFKRSALNDNIKIHISKKFLLYYRIHNSQTMSIERENKNSDEITKKLDIEEQKIQFEKNKKNFRELSK